MDLPFRHICLPGNDCSVVDERKGVVAAARTDARGAPLCVSITCTASEEQAGALGQAMS